MEDFFRRLLAVLPIESWLKLVVSRIRLRLQPRRSEPAADGTVFQQDRRDDLEEFFGETNDLDGVFKLEVKARPKYNGMMILERGKLYYSNNVGEFGYGTYVVKDGSVTTFTNLWQLDEKQTPRHKRYVKAKRGKWNQSKNVLTLVTEGSDELNREVHIVCTRRRPIDH